MEKKIEEIELPDYNGTKLIGDVKEHFKNVFREDRRWNIWRAFYNGWIDGRGKMLIDYFNAKKVIESQQKELKELREEKEELNEIIEYMKKAYYQDIKELKELREENKRLKGRSVTPDC